MSRVPGRGARPARRHRVPEVRHSSRIVENFDIFDPELAPDDIDAISALNRDERIGPDPDEFNCVP